MTDKHTSEFNISVKGEYECKKRSEVVNIHKFSEEDYVTIHGSKGMYLSGTFVAVHVSEIDNLISALQNMKGQIR